MFKKTRGVIAGVLNGKKDISVLKNIALVASITTIIAIVGVYKDSIVTSGFGMAEFLDSYYIAYFIPAIVQSVFLNSFKNVFVPNYVAQQKSNEGSKEMLYSFQTLCLLIVLGIVIIVILLLLLFDSTLLEIVYSNHSESWYALVREQLYIIIPCLFFWGFSAFLSGVLDIHGKFLYSALYPIFISISVIFCFLFLREQLGVKVLATGILSGAVLGFIFLLFFCFHFELIKFRKPKITPNAVIMLKQMPPKITSGILTDSNRQIDQIFAAQLTAGSVTALGAGARIPSFILSFSMVAMGNVLLPYFSKKIQENQRLAFKELFRILKIVFVIGLFVTGLFFLFSEEIIALLYQRKQFTAADTVMVSTIQQIILVYVPFYLCGNLLGKFLTSINKNSFMAWVSLFNLCTNLLFNFIFVKLYGVYGLAISTSLVITISSFIYFYFTLRQYKKLEV